MIARARSGGSAPPPIASIIHRATCRRRRAWRNRRALRLRPRSELVGCWGARAGRRRGSRVGSARGCPESRRHRVGAPSPPGGALSPYPTPRRLPRSRRSRQGGGPRIWDRAPSRGWRGCHSSAPTIASGVDGTKTVPICLRCDISHCADPVIVPILCPGKSPQHTEQHA